MGKKYQNTILFHHGELNYEIINELLDDLNLKLSQKDISTLCRKRVYSTAVEALENILRHSLTIKKPQFKPKFSIEEHGKDIFIESCNLVSAEQRKELEAKIGYINDNSDRLKKLFAEKLKNSSISDEGGAGLGVYIIGKNASQEIEYSFKTVNKKESYFCIKIKI